MVNGNKLEGIYNLKLKPVFLEGLNIKLGHGNNLYQWTPISALASNFDMHCNIHVKNNLSAVMNMYIIFVGNI